MAFARPPQYGLQRPKKPRLVSAPQAPRMMTRWGGNPQPQPQTSPYYTGWGRQDKPPTPGYTPPPGQAPPTQAAPPVAAPQSLTPPPTLAGQNQRIAAGTTYGLTQEQINAAIRREALKYGGAPKIQQFGYTQDPQGNFLDTSNLVDLPAGYDQDPLSILSQIVRAETEGKKGIGDEALRAGTFLSSRKEGQQTEVGNEANRQRTQAQRDYDDAVSALVSQLMGGRATRGAAYGEANVTDTTAALAGTPEPVAATAPAKKDYTEQVGTNKAGEAGTWHTYPNRKVFVKKPRKK